MSKKGKNKRSRDVITKNELCLLCQKRDCDEVTLGKMVIADGVQCHYYCLLFACGLCQEGEDEQGLCGFLVEDVRKEARRGHRLTCRYCKQKGATSACSINSCRATFHYPCGIKHDTLHQFFDQFNSYCSTHRPVQSIPLKYSCSSGNKNSQIECGNCLEKMTPKAPFFNELFTPCCRKWLHRKCVQQQAYNAGLFFFKCPLCNNKDEFVNEMTKFGIYAPEKDASWELEENAFQELHETHNICDAEECLCPNGRKFDDDNDSDWCIVVCEMCASQGVHIKCGNVAEDELQTWACEVCAVVKKKTEIKSPSPKRIRTIHYQNCVNKIVDNWTNQCQDTQSYNYRTNESDSSDKELKPMDLSSKNIDEIGIECKNVRVNNDKIPIITID